MRKYMIAALMSQNLLWSNLEVYCLGTLLASQHFNCSQCKLFFN